MGNVDLRKLRKKQKTNDSFMKLNDMSGVKGKLFSIHLIDQIFEK